jgi:subtilisin family serine protease
LHKAARAKAVARIVAALALLLASGSLLAGGPLASAGVPARASVGSGTLPAQPASKIAPDVLSATAGGQVAPIAILLAEQADLSAAYSITDRDARGRFVYDNLRSHAGRTQAGLRAELDALGTGYTSFWVANVIFTHGDRALVERLAARSDVKLIESNARRRVIAGPVLPGKADGSLSPEAVEWNIARVHAPEVWSLGYRGEGIVIGINDTGVQWDHPALKPQYRGWNGATADHNYNWHDAIHTDPSTCPGNSPVPCEGYSHGSHVTGIAVGDDGVGNQIGVAPGADWIACRSMDTAGNGTPQTYTECLQFFLAPYDLAGQNANPDLRPHVVNNSWGCTPSEGCDSANLQVLKPIVENVQAAGILVVSSAGNSGSTCGSVNQPIAIYDATFTTGGTTITDELWSGSSRGPVTVDGSNRLKPNISAPGQNVRSSLKGGGYGQLTGTSMASPHVAGSVALLWNAWPDLQRDITTTKTLLQNTADPDITVPGGQVCGGTGPTTIPNNLFGYGLVDAYAAVAGYCQTTTQDVYEAAAIAPASITIPAGSTVRWTSQGDTHTSTSNTGLWDSGNIPPGNSFSYTFNTPGTYTYQCKLHPGMAGTVNVIDPCSGATRTPTNTPTSTPTLTHTPTATSTPTTEPTATLTDTATATATATQAVPPSATATSSSTNSATRTATLEPAATATPCGGTLDVVLGTAPGSANRPSGVCPPPTSATPTTTATTSGCAIQFADVPPTGEGSTFYSFVRCLACRSIVGGYPCGGRGEPCNGGDEPYFRPNTNVTRGQIAKMVALSAELDAPTGEQTFEDVAPGSPFYGPIQQLANAGYIGGYPCGSVPSEPCGPGSRPYFRPAANATRGQVSKIVSETAQLTGDPGQPRFADVPEGSPFFIWVNRLANQGVISGYPCGSPGETCDDQDRPYFRPNENVTRGQTAKIVANTFYPNCQAP